MRAHDFFFGPEKLRTPWRFLLFLVLTTAAALVVGALPSRFAFDRFWATIVHSGILVAALLVASFVMMRWVERRRFAALGLPLGEEPIRDWLKGAAVGGGIITVLVLVQLVAGWLRPTPESGAALDWLGRVGGLAVLFAIAAAAEELLFRGYAFQVLVEGLGATLAVGLTAGLFAAAHLGNPEIGAVAILNIGLAGVLLAAAYLRTRSLWVAIGLHWAWNWSMAAVFDLPVSGVDFDVPGYDLRELGPDLFTGGSFGPEGSLLATIVMALSIVWIFRTGWLAESPRMAALKPLIDARNLP